MNSRAVRAAAADFFEIVRRVDQQAVISYPRVAQLLKIWPPKNAVSRRTVKSALDTMDQVISLRALHQHFLVCNEKPVPSLLLDLLPGDGTVSTKQVSSSIRVDPTDKLDTPTDLTLGVVRPLKLLANGQVAKRIRQHPVLKNVVLVASTGYDQDSDRQTSLEAGFNHHLVKPAEVAEILQILATVSEQVT